MHYKTRETLPASPPAADHNSPHPKQGPKLSHIQVILLFAFLGLEWKIQTFQEIVLRKISLWNRYYYKWAAWLWQKNQRWIYQRKIKRSNIKLEWLRAKPFGIRYAKWKPLRINQAETKAMKVHVCVFKKANHDTNQQQIKTSGSAGNGLFCSLRWRVSLRPPTSRKTFQK